MTVKFVLLNDDGNTLNEYNLKFSESTTKNVYEKNTFVYQFLSSMRQRLNDPFAKRKKID